MGSEQPRASAGSGWGQPEVSLSLLAPAGKEGRVGGRGRGAGRVRGASLCWVCHPIQPVPASWGAPGVWGGKSVTSARKEQ